MESIVDVKDCLDSMELLNILAESVYNPTIEHLKNRAEKYKNNPHTRIYALKQDNRYIGVIVLELGISNKVEILNLAVRKEFQKTGVGKKLINFCVGEVKLDCIIAETDDEAVEFYRKVGFSIQPLGDKYGVGINRYLCTLVNLSYKG